MSSLLVKAEGAGNDFILGAGAWAGRIVDDPEWVIALCHRRRGVGADGALAVLVDGPGTVRVVHRNADGSLSAFCANGTRCAARLAVDRLGCHRELAIRTGWSELAARVAGDRVELELPPPSAPVERTLAVGSNQVVGTLLWVGVPHLVVPVVGLAELDLETTARPLRHHPDLGPEGANVHLVEPIGDDALAIRSLERGVPAEVLCCGSGVVAAGLLALAATGRESITVVPLSGDALIVEALGEPPTAPSRLVGPARLVAEIDPL
ncbi:MAG: diaminopimelate epimerase [Thermoanaerobaculales bacterium]|nr:diaminopimelate epimerase [Thermoanaerobaculales bacterium]